MYKLFTKIKKKLRKKDSGYVKVSFMCDLCEYNTSNSILFTIHKRTCKKGSSNYHINNYLYYI